MPLFDCPVAESLDRPEDRPNPTSTSFGPVRLAVAEHEPFFRSEELGEVGDVTAVEPLAPALHDLEG
ncbi:hypothetical protein [Pseudonocardia ammonioxydans]|uniref:hypothetical protein n=1 Tax=Pseudonocardia ammonioxydans TaxID=260086 RepID=UPI001160980C|nr:hypothetical protein [Pseudonocardia ammonioxydans]